MDSMCMWLCISVCSLGAASRFVVDRNDLRFAKEHVSDKGARVMVFLEGRPEAIYSFQESFAHSTLF